MITIKKGHYQLNYKKWDFPAGEIGVRIDTNNYAFLTGQFEGAHWTITYPHISIWASIQKSDDILELLMVIDALKRWDRTPIRLILTWIPYARQDRVCTPGESLSLRVFADLINNLNCKEVYIFDPHSDVSSALINNCNIIDQKTIISSFDKFNKRLQPTNPNDRPIFVSPDAGANKKTAELASFYGHQYFIRADKLRDLPTGKIKEMVVINPREEIEGKDIIIVDDIGDKCGTFIGLTKVFKDKGAASVQLYITHALLTGPTPHSILSNLFDIGVSHVWTTNSYRNDLEGISSSLTVLNLESVFTL